MRRFFKTNNAFDFWRFVGLIKSLIKRSFLIMGEAAAVINMFSSFIFSRLALFFSRVAYLQRMGCRSLHTSLTFTMSIRYFSKITIYTTV